MIGFKSGCIVFLAINPRGNAKIDTLNNCGSLKWHIFVFSSRFYDHRTTADVRGAGKLAQIAS